MALKAMETASIPDPAMGTKSGIVSVHVVSYRRSVHGMSRFTELELVMTREGRERPTQEKCSTHDPSADRTPNEISKIIDRILRYQH